VELSPREQEILARLEDELATDGGGPAEAVGGRPGHGSRVLRTWLGLAGLLALGLLAVIAAAVLVPDLGPTAFGVLTVGVVALWVVLALRSLRGHQRHE
jgi:hypothetical protein